MNMLIFYNKTNPTNFFYQSCVYSQIYSAIYNTETG